MRQLPRLRTWLVLAAVVLAVTLAWGTGVAGVAVGRPGISASMARAEGSAGDPTSMASTRPSTDEVNTAAARLLAVRSGALANHDPAAWESTIADPTSENGSRQMSAYSGLEALGVSELTTIDVRPISPSLGPAGDADRLPYTVTAMIGHQIPGFDRTPRVAMRTLTLVSTTAGWRIESDASATDQLQVWDLPDLRVVRSATTLVAGNAPLSTLADRLADADAATPRLATVFGAATPSVLVVPATGAQAARQLGRPESAAADQVAATTDGPTGPLGTAGADRVVLGPEAFGRLTAEGRRVVVTHELTHVAARASMGAQVPLWLSEGFAEYVAWGPVNMPVQAAAAQLLTKVRTEGAAPETLPGARDFDSSRSDLATAYQGSWLAVRRITAEHGEAALLAFYRAVAGAPGRPGLSVDDAFGTVLGTTAQAFLDGWRDELQRLAR